MLKAIPLALILALTIPACIIVDDDPGGPGPGIAIADLQVTFTIDGSSDASLCSVYGIDHWIVETSGPETRTSHIDCFTHFWSTENDFMGIEEGSYLITVQAFDAANYQKGTMSTSLDLVDIGTTDKVHLDFAGADIN